MFTQLRKFSLVVLLVCAMMVVNAPSASACSCAGGLPLINEIASAAAIFSGKVTESAPPPQTVPALEPPYNGLHTTVEVTKMWKGPDGQRMTVVSSACGYSFEVGKEYLIFALAYEDLLLTSICTPTQPLETAGDLPFTLDALFRPPPLEPVAQAATVTVTGRGRRFATADQIEVQMYFTAERQGTLPTEEERQHLADLLMARGEATDVFFGNEDGFYWRVYPPPPFNDFEAFMVELKELEELLRQDSEAGIDHLEVKFSLKDCTLPASNVRSSALFDARTRAEMLAAVAGGRRGEVISIVEPPSDSAPDDYAGLCTLAVDKWYPLPLPSDIVTLSQIELRASLTVTFAVEEAVQTATAPVSPLPTPTAP